MHHESLPNTVRQGPRFRLWVRGRHACFTDPALKVERVSYPIPTPSAGQGMFDQILRKAGMRWTVDEIAVLRPIRWASFRRNEVTTKSSAHVDHLVVDEFRTQRHGRVLADVEYVLTASFKLTPLARPEDTVEKYTEMFERRVSLGQVCGEQPYLGCREFGGDFGVPPVDYVPIGESRNLGLMLYGILYDRDRCLEGRPLFYEARMERGIVRVPPWPVIAAQNGVDPALGGAR